MILQPNKFTRITAMVFVIAALLAMASPVLCQPAIPTNTYPPLNVWPFDDTTNWTSGYGYAPVSFTNLGVSYAGDGTALILDNTNAAWLQFNMVESDGTTNLTVDQGSVLFWFAPDWTSINLGGSGPGLSGRLIEVGSNTLDASYGWWSIYVDTTIAVNSPIRWHRPI